MLNASRKCLNGIREVSGRYFDGILMESGGCVEGEEGLTESRSLLKSASMALSRWCLEGVLNVSRVF